MITENQQYPQKRMISWYQEIRKRLLVALRTKEKIAKKDGKVVQQ